MPPRLPASCCAQLSNCLDNALVATQRRATAAGRGRPLQTPTHPSVPSSSASFSTTAPRDATRNRRNFYKWLRTDAKKLRYKKAEEPYGPTYVNRPNFKGKDTATANLQPFLENPEFVSQPVLSAKARQILWEDVMVKGLPLKAVSVRRNVDIRRVAAVIRMMTIEKELKRTGQIDQLATKFSRTMLSMLPVHNLQPTDKPFESITDVEVHPYTQQQLFVPTAESHRFTRVDAAKAFGNKILPPDRKLPVPEVIDLERDIAAGVEDSKARMNFLEKATASEAELASKTKSRENRKNSKTIRVDTGRFEFRIEKINAGAVGGKGRSRIAAGWRYGVPFDDRKRGAVKIPTKVV